VEQQLNRVAQGEAAARTTAWQALACRGDAVAMRVLLLNDQWATHDVVA